MSLSWLRAITRPTEFGRISWEWANPFIDRTSSRLRPPSAAHVKSQSMARQVILAHSVAFLAACLGASCITPPTPQETIPDAKEPPPLALVKWDDLPLELKKASVPPYSAISYCALRASAQGSDPEAVKADLAECLSADLLATQGTFLVCHLAASNLQGKAYAEQRRKCLIQSGAKPG